METYKRRLGDRKDGQLLRHLDPMHFIVPLLYPDRCDNEAYISVNVDLAPIKAFLAEKNAAEEEFPYTMFHVILAAIVKTVTLRPKMNRFIANKNTYQRNHISASFVVKKQFKDDSAEALAILRCKEDDTLTSIHQEIVNQITACRSETLDASTDSMDLFNRLPRFLSKFGVWFITKLDKLGLVPQSLIASDPYYSTVVLSNVGSIGLKSGYHHLTNWGTNSLFCLIGEKKMSPFYDEAGNVTMHETLDMGLTVDERIADGYYYSKSVKLLKYLLAHPELLELPLKEKVQYE